MRSPLKIVSGAGKMLLTGFAMLIAMMMPAIGYSQSSPPPPGPGGNGGNPDSPLGVPFDTNMTIAFLVVAVVYAVVYLKRLQKAKLQNNI